MYSSLDILYIVIAFCLFWLSAAIFWLVWQVASIFRNINHGVSELREKIKKIEEAVEFIRGKFDHMSTTLGVVVSGLTKVIEFAMDHREHKKRPLFSRRHKLAKEEEEMEEVDLEEED
jgi:predicted PurR-regulated permease PerM